MLEVDHFQKRAKSLSKSMKLIPLAQVPKSAGSGQPTNIALIEKIKNIPIGMALVVNEDDLAEFDLPSITAIRVTVRRYVKRGLIPKNIRAVERKRMGKTTVYILSENLEETRNTSAC